MVYAVQSKQDFDDRVEGAGGKLVVVDFFATWCGPCKVIAPKLEELSVKYDDKVIVLKVDVDDCEEIAMEYKIQSMPTFIFIKCGKEIDRFSGANTENLEKNFAKYAQ